MVGQGPPYLAGPPLLLSDAMMLNSRIETCDPKRKRRFVDRMVGQGPTLLGFDAGIAAGLRRFRAGRDPVEQEAAMFGPGLAHRFAVDQAHRGVVRPHAVAGAKTRA